MNLVRGRGLEPLHHYWRQDLNLVRLPISPPSQSSFKGLHFTGIFSCQCILHHAMQLKTVMSFQFMRTVTINYSRDLTSLASLIR